jgi:hypothetical protein
VNLGSASKHCSEEKRRKHTQHGWPGKDRTWQIPGNNTYVAMKQMLKNMLFFLFCFLVIFPKELQRPKKLPTGHRQRGTG